MSEDTMYSILGKKYKNENTFRMDRCVSAEKGIWCDLPQVFSMTPEKCRS